MIKLEIMDKEGYNLYWKNNAAKESTESGFDTYLNYVNSGNSIKTGYLNTQNTECKKLFGITYHTIRIHSKNLQKLNILKRTETFWHKERTPLEKQLIEESIIKTQLRKAIKNMTYPQLIEIKKVMKIKDE